VLSNPNFGSIVTEAGGGYTWFGNSRQFKLTAWSNDPVCDHASEQLWLRDEATYEVTRLISDAKRVRFCTGSANYENDLLGVRASIDVWVDSVLPIKLVRIRIKNETDQPRSLSLTMATRFVLCDHADASRISVSSSIDDELRAVIAQSSYHEDFPNVTAAILTSEANSTYSANASAFKLRDRKSQLPLAMKQETLDGTDGARDDSHAAIRSLLSLEKHSEGEICFAIAASSDQRQLSSFASLLSSPSSIDSSLMQTSDYWRAGTQPFFVQTPNVAFDRLVNDWLLYQTIACRMYARSAFYQCGGAFGFRDQLQDSMAAVYSMPEVTRQQILRCASRQFVEGDVQHWWHEPSGKGTRTRFSDDRLFLPYATMHYVAVTGDDSIWDQNVSYLSSKPLDSGEQERYEQPTVSAKAASLWQHCLAAIDISLQFGAHGLPLMGCGDWNDGMNRVGAQSKGESIWVAWFLVHVLDELQSNCRNRLTADQSKHYMSVANNIRKSIERHAWDGDWYLRAFFDDGSPLGSSKNETCQIDSLVQSWAVITNGDRPRSKHAFFETINRLVDNDTGLIKLFTPAFDRDPIDPGYINAYVPGVRENGGQYTHAAIWLAQAAALLGERDLAMRLFDYMNPLSRTQSPEAAATYRLEPYVMAADIYTSPQHVGRGGWSWYTGSAGWMYRLAIETILGIKVTGSYIRCTPQVPDSWDSFAITIRIAGKRITLKCSKQPSETLQSFTAGQPIDVTKLDDESTIHVRY
jgi:cyclic beta-1,2-glucan synthetase